MKSIFQILLLSALTFGAASSSFGINYNYFSDTEQTAFGAQVSFWGGDSLTGIVRSNGFIAISGSPQFRDLVITSAPDFWRGPSYNPRFTERPCFNAPPLALPVRADSIRALAYTEGHFFYGGPGMQARIELIGDSLKLWWAFSGAPFDTVNHLWCALPPRAVLFFQCDRLHLFGRISTELIIGTSGLAGLEDNVLYASSDPVTGEVAWEHPEKFALISEGEIKILNTVANGRENSSGQGFNQIDQNLTSIALNGVFTALGESFTFDQQNDPDSGYVCSCLPDDRGMLYLWGSLQQRRRGYVHRSTRGSSGYLKALHYDPLIQYWHLPLFNARENAVTPAAVRFDTTAPYSVVHDTITIRNDYVPVVLDSFHVHPPFYVTGDNFPADSYRWSAPLMVRFAPDAPGNYTGTLFVWPHWYHTWIAIPLSGTARAVSSASDRVELPADFAVSVYPNPFNLSTTIQYTLPFGVEGTLSVFDLAGRVVRDYSVRGSAGAQRLNFHADGMSSGVYFVQLNGGGQSEMRKLLLIK